MGNRPKAIVLAVLLVPWRGQFNICTHHDFPAGCATRTSPSPAVAADAAVNPSRAYPNLSTYQYPVPFSAAPSSRRSLSPRPWRRSMMRLRGLHRCAAPAAGLGDGFIIPAATLASLDRVMSDWLCTVFRWVILERVSTYLWRPYC